MPKEWTLKLFHFLARDFVSNLAWTFQLKIILKFINDQDSST